MIKDADNTLINLIDDLQDLETNNLFMTHTSTRLTLKVKILQITPLLSKETIQRLQHPHSGYSQWLL
jgi:hypothetical protein